MAQRIPMGPSGPNWKIVLKWAPLTVKGSADTSMGPLGFSRNFMAVDGFHWLLMGPDRSQWLPMTLIGFQNFMTDNSHN